MSGWCERWAWVHGLAVDAGPRRAVYLYAPGGQLAGACVPERIGWHAEVISPAGVTRQARFTSENVARAWIESRARAAFDSPGA